MKAMSMPPSDPRVRQMNDAQWLFCYFNQLEDEKEESESWKARLDYLTWFINPDMAKRVSETNEQNKASNQSGYQGPRYQKSDLHTSSDFEKETFAAMKGYDPESGLTVDEFIAELESNSNKEPDIMNDSFDDLLTSGEFREVADPTQGIGNPGESLDEFVYRALMLEEEMLRREAENKSEDNNTGSFNVPKDKEAESEDYDLDLDVFEVDEYE